MRKIKKRIVLNGESQIVEVFVELKGGIVIAVDKKYYNFYMPLKPEDEKNQDYQLMMSAPIIVMHGWGDEYINRRTEAFTKAIAKGKIDMTVLDEKEG